MSQKYTPGRPHYEHFARRIFSEAPFMCDLGVEVFNVSPGLIETLLEVQPKHRQQNGFLHAGVAASIADHSAGAAAATLMPEGKVVLTVEFKINLLRPGAGDSLRCRAEVLKPGKSICVAESEVFMTQGIERLIAKATVTLAYVEIGDATK